MGATPKQAKNDDIKFIGPRADLRDRDLTGFDLRKFDLSNATLRNAKLGPGTLLWNVNFTDADLYHTNFRGADLQDVNFSNADLFQADLRESNLQGADLSTAKGGLLSRQLAGSDLTGAKLPEPLAKLYDSLSSVKEISDSAQKLFLALLAGCLYSWLTIAQTTDVELITNRATTPLPIIQAAIPIVGFYVVAPLILLCLYFYFHFYLQKLWEELGSLPAIFMDGRELHKRTDPWLLNDLVRSHFVKLKDGRPFLSYFQSWVSVVLAWWLVPVTLFGFWLRFLRTLELPGILFHSLVLSSGIFGAIQLYRIANRTLHGEMREAFSPKKLFTHGRNYVRAFYAILLISFVLTLSFGVVFGVAPKPQPESRFLVALKLTSPKTWVPGLLERLGYYPYPNFKFTEVSVKPTNWIEEQDKKLDTITGAKLSHRNMWNADAAGAFLVKADLSWNAMNNIILSGADARRANLQSSVLNGANLVNAFLQDSDMDTTWLQHADLEYAHLDRAYMMHANLNNANLFEAILSHAYLHSADLSHADLGRAKLDGVELYGANLSEARLGGADLTGSRLEGAGLRRAKLSLATLVHVNFRGADLTDANLQNADMKFADFRKEDYPGGNLTRGLTPTMLRTARNCEMAFYDPDMLKQLGLPTDHNEKLQKQMGAELEQAKSPPASATLK